MDRLAATLTVLDYAAVAVFGATGALAAARRKHDIVTFGFFAAVTGVGGGTLRDLLIGAPVFWVGRPGYLVVCLAAAARSGSLGPGRVAAGDADLARCPRHGGLRRGRRAEGELAGRRRRSPRW